MFARHDDRKLLGHQVGLALAADSGGINKAKRFTITCNEFVHRISSSARDRRDNRAFCASELVEKSGFADVGMADDGDFDFRRSLVVGRWQFVGLRSSVRSEEHT